MAKDLVTLHNAFRISPERPIECYAESIYDSGSFSISGTFFLSESGSIDGVHYENLIQQFGKWSVSAHNGEDIYARFDPVTERVFFYSDGEFKLNFPTDEDAKYFGFTSGLSSSVLDPSSALWGLSGSRVPWNHWREFEDSRGEWHRDYEPEPIFFEHIADDGTIYSFGKSGSVTQSDWIFDVQPQERVRASYAPEDRPFTFENLQKETRNIFPILVFTGSSDYSWERKENVYLFRSEGTKFDPEKIFPDYEDYLRLRCQFFVLGGS